MIFIIPNQVPVGNQPDVINARTVPYIATAIIIFFSLINLIQDVRQREEEDSQGDLHPEGEEVKQKGNYIGVILTIILLFAWTFILPVLGFIITNLIIVGAFVLLLGNRNIWAIIFVPILFTVSAHLLFQKLLKIRLPSGIFF